MEAQPDFIAEQVIAYLKANCEYDPSLALAAPVQFLEKPWSVVYFLTLSERDQQHRMVAKISRFPDQKTAEESWQEEHLIDRGVREYNSLERIYRYFLEQNNDMLRAVRPIAFIRSINAIVMDFVVGDSFYKACLSPRRVVTPGAHDLASNLAIRTGEWLRMFHRLSDIMPEKTAEESRSFSPAMALDQLFDAVKRLQQRNVDPTRWANWAEIESTLKQIDSQQRVWIHSDFHMGNAMVLPEYQILSMDTGLDKRDHPYTDVGKFLADIQTRWLRTMSYELLPNRAMVEDLRERFLDGYLQGDALDRRVLALYEGQYLFEKWIDSLESLENRLSDKVPPLIGNGLGKYVLSPTFTQILQRWAERDLLTA